MFFNILAIFTIVAAFVLCSLFFGAFLADDSRSFLDVIEQYQTLIAGVLAIFAACIGGIYVLNSVYLQRHFKEDDFISDQMQILIDAYYKLENLDLSASNAQQQYREIMDELGNGLKANTILRRISKDIGFQTKTIIYSSTPSRLSSKFINEKKEQIMLVYGLLKLKTGRK